ncbi:MAG TPA: hypothetical protein V6D22_00055 [Candidatus Obscuribacterales bacterium]
MNKVVTCGLLSLLTVAFSAPAFAQAVDVGGTPAGDPGAAADTAASGDTGMTWDNAPTSDVTMTQGNNESQFFIPPPSTTATQKTRQNLYQGITQQRTGNRLLAPLSVLQFGDMRSFKGPYDLGFPDPKGVPFSQNAMGYNNPTPWGPGIPFIPLGLPTTGTPSVDADVTQGGGY